MQKYLVATALLAVYVSAADVDCQITTAPTPGSACDAIAVTKAPPADVTLTGDSPRLFATITYEPAPSTTATCADAKLAGSVSACDALINIIGEPSAEDGPCLELDAEQGDAKGCGIADGDDCTADQFCENFEQCNTEGKCGDESGSAAPTINCVAVNTLADTAVCTSAQAVDIALAAGVSLTPEVNVVTITYEPGTFTDAVTCANVATVDPTLDACVSALEISEPSAEQVDCFATDAVQGVSQACGIADGDDCTVDQFCENFPTCNADGKCAAAPFPSVNCIAVNKPSETSCSSVQAVDFAFELGVSLTPAANAVTITYNPGTSTDAVTCANVATVDPTLATCVGQLTLTAPSAEQTECMSPGATQGFKKACALPDDAICTETQFCENFEQCNSEGKCAVPPPPTISCISAKKPSETTCDPAKVKDFTLATGVSFTPVVNAVTITYEPGASSTPVTCSNIGSIDATLATCAGELTLSVPSVGQDTCMAPDVKQGVDAACALPNGAACTTAQFCQNFPCNSEGQCAAEPEPPAKPVQYTWSNIPTTNVEELTTQLAELFPEEPVPGNPCSNLGLTFTVDSVFPNQENAFISASEPVPSTCLAHIADLNISTAAQTACHNVESCGIQTCMCEKDNACVVNADGTSNCLSGFTCETEEGATTGVCSSTVLASAAFAIAVALLALLF